MPILPGRLRLKRCQKAMMLQIFSSELEWQSCRLERPAFMFSPKIVKLSAIWKPDLARLRSGGGGPPMHISTLFSTLVLSPLITEKSVRMFFKESREN